MLSPTKLNTEHPRNIPFIFKVDPPEDTQVFKRFNFPCKETQTLPTMAEDERDSFPMSLIIEEGVRCNRILPSALGGFHADRQVYIHRLPEFASQSPNLQFAAPVSSLTIHDIV